jgi:hypothetical protein
MCGTVLGVLLEAFELDGGGDRGVSGSSVAVAANGNISIVTGERIGTRLINESTFGCLEFHESLTGGGCNKSLSGGAGGAGGAGGVAAVAGVRIERRPNESAVCCLDFKESLNSGGDL